MAETLRIEVGNAESSLVVLIKEMLQLEDSINSAKDSSEDLSKAMKSVKDEAKAAGDAVANLSDNSEKMEESAEKAEKAVSKFDESVKKNTKSIKDMVKDKYKLALEAIDKVSPILKLMGTGIKALTGKAWKITMKAVDFVTPSLKDIKKNFKELYSKIKDTFSDVKEILGIDFGLKDSIDTYAAFEAAMSRVKVLTSATSGEFAQLSQKAKDMGKTTKFSATESAEAFEHMALSGWETADMLAGIESIMALAEISGESLTGMADILSEALDEFGLGSKDIEYFSDVLAQTAVNARTSISEISTALKSVGDVSSSLGYRIQDISVALGLMVESGMEGSAAGNSLNTILTRLSANTDGAADAIRTLGVEFFNSDGSARDLSQVMNELRHATANMSEEQKSNLAETVAGMEAQKGLLIILNATVEDYDSLARAIENAEGATKQMLSMVNDNLQGAFTSLQSALEGIKVTLGERLKPYIQSFTLWLGNKMPDIEKAIGKTMDFIDKKMIQLRYTIKRMMNSSEWEDADLFGKISIAWDELIGNPFMKWWNGTGKQMIADAMGTVGKGIGIGLGAGLMAILGFDISGVVNDGVSIGAAFAQGISEGFQGEGVKNAVWGAIKGIFSSAGGIFSGDADITNWLSLLLVGKAAVSTGNTLVKGAQLGGKVLNGSSGSGGLLSLLGSPGTGSGILGFGANTAINLGAGNLAGNASLSAGALSAVGLGAVTGAAIGGTTLISGIKDFSTAYKSEDRDKMVAYRASGLTKSYGVAGGAAIGATLGAGFFGIGAVPGALIGAGIGGIAGMVSGNKEIKKYEEELRRAEERARAFKIAQEQAKYESEKLKTALADTTISAAEFAKMLNEVVAENMASRFGDIVLSLAEIQELAEHITFGESIVGLRKFSDASYQARNDYATFVNSVDALDKQNWKAGLGALDTNEIADYKNSVNGILSNAKKYVESQHYEVTAAIKLLFTDTDNTDLILSVNELFSDKINRLNELDVELGDVIKNALSDGIVTPEEQNEINSLFNEVNEIVDMLSGAEMNASLELLKAKYGGADLSVDSFMNLQMELGPILEEQSNRADEAFKTVAHYADLLQNAGIITNEQYQEYITDATDARNTKKSQWLEESQNYQLGVITDKYGKELESVLPDFDGTLEEQLSQIIEKAMWDGLDFSKINIENPDDLSDIVSLFSLDSLETEYRVAISKLLLLTAQSLPAHTYTDLNNIKADIINETFALTPLGSDYTGLYSTNLTMADDFSDTIYLMKDIADSKGIEHLLFDDNDAEEILDSLNRAVQTKKWLIKEGFDPVADEALQAIIDKLSDIDVETTINVTPKYKLNSTELWTGGLIRPDGTKGEEPIFSANGGFINSKVLSWVGEEGPEVIIPLVSGRRSRGLDLWYQAGKLLGVGKHINGDSIISAKGLNSHFNSKSFNDFEPYYNSVSGGLGANDWANTSSDLDYGVANYSGGGTDINIQISLEPSFDIHRSSESEGSEERIIDTIKAHMGEMADELSGEIATTLEQIFSNMPKKNYC